MELNAIITGANTVPTRQSMPQRLRAADLRPKSQAIEDLQDAKVNRAVQGVKLFSRLLRQNHLGHLQRILSVIDVLVKNIDVMDQHEECAVADPGPDFAGYVLSRFQS